MTELEKSVIPPLSEKGILKFYGRYVDDTLTLMKPEHVQLVLEKLNSFHKNLHFTVDTFENGPVHFLDLLLDKNSIDLYRRYTNTGQYISFARCSSELYLYFKFM